jgi:hypothetical protein
MKDIQPITLWVGGSTEQANVFDLRIINDNLKDYATLYYRLGHESIPADPDLSLSVNWLQDGNLNIDGQPYDDWTNEPDSNTWIYDWAAGQLNLVIIEP